MMLSLYYSCGNGNGSNNGIFKSAPDSTNLPEMAIFLEKDQLDKIINEETTLSNGKKRHKGEYKTR